jgi:mutator protein MutT
LSTGERLRGRERLSPSEPLSPSEQLKSDEKPRSIIHVVAGAVTDPGGRVLIAQRPPGKHLAGSWEFPGGKLEPGEGRALGLARELREELGITIREPRPLIRVRHAYPYGEVLIDMWVVTRYDGEPQGLDGQALRWCHQDELAEVDLLPADKPIVRALRLPERLREASSPYYVVSEPGGLSRPNGRLSGVWCSSAEESVAAASGEGHCSQGPGDFLVMRCALPEAELAELCRAVSVPVYARGEHLERAWALGASGLNDLSD